MLIWYRNSFLASVVSLLGSGAGIMAISMLISGEFMIAIAFAPIAAALLYLGKKISEKKAFGKWWKQVENANLEPAIRQSIETAVAVYKKNPEKRTLEKIRGLNPSAAAYIENGFRGTAPNAYQAPAVAAPAQQNPRPVQQNPRPAQKVIFCTQCGQQLPLGSRFCSSCGTPTSNGQV